MSDADTTTVTDSVRDDDSKSGIKEDVEDMVTDAEDGVRDLVTDAGDVVKDVGDAVGDMMGDGENSTKSDEIDPYQSEEYHFLIAATCAQKHGHGEFRCLRTRHNLSRQFRIL